MASFSAVAIVYITIQSFSLLLLLRLMIFILKSKSLFLKWTLLQLCISAFSYGMASLPPIMFFGNDLITRAFENPLCVVMQKISAFFIYPLEFFSIAIAFYLWFFLVMRINVEIRYGRFVSGAIWIYTTTYNTFLLISARNNEHLDVIPSKLNCKITKNHGSFYGYIIPTSILVFVTFLMSCHSSVLLWKRWLHHSSRMNRTTAIKLGETIRLCSWCFVYIIWTLLLLVPRILINDPDIHKIGMAITTMMIANMNSASIGTYLFLIFGTEKRAALFLCCYYVPPGTPRAQEVDVQVESPNTQDFNTSFISSSEENSLVEKV